MAEYTAIMLVLLISLDFTHVNNSADDWNNVEISSPAWNGSVPDRVNIIFRDSGNGTFHLTSTLNISAVNNVRIAGDNVSMIECSGKNNTGIILTEVENLHMENLRIRNCFNSWFNTSMYIANCTNITIRNVSVENGNGCGLMLVNNSEEIRIENSAFQNNGRMYNTEQSQESRHARIYNTNNELKGGGGLQVLLGSDVNNSSVNIMNCSFLNNNALNGGGMLVMIQPRAQGNNVTIQGSTFTDNKCCNGGGGLQIGYVSNKQENEVKNNTIAIKNCIFSSNRAMNGGGTAIFSTLGSYDFSQNKINFTNCTWTSNTAKLGMAVDVAIAPWETYTKFGLFPSPAFKNCTFSVHKPNNALIRIPRSVVSVTGFRLAFKENMLFKDNMATAIDATSAVLSFQPHSNVEFIHNTGYYGGALRLNGMSVMYVKENSMFTFRGNRARSGGAIYAKIFEHLILTTPPESCFIQFKGASKKPQNVTFYFTNNSVEYNNRNTGSSKERGNIIYATTIAPCLRKCLTNSAFLNVTDALNCIGNFVFDKPNAKHISTGAHHFSLKNTSSEDDQLCQLFVDYTSNIIRINQNYTSKKNPLKDLLHFIPGKVEELPLKLVDDLCGEVFFHVSIQLLEITNGTISLDSAHSVVTDNRITLYGEPHSTGTIQVSTVGNRMIAMPINVTMDECPPGYVLHNNNTCLCSASSHDDYHPGIEKCNDILFQAYAKHGYWVGYVSRTNKTLRSSICPKGFCTSDTHLLYDTNLTNKSELAEGKASCPKGFFCPHQLSEHLLPSSYSTDLSPHVCHLNREGVLCGVCKANHSAMYRSMSFSCKPDNLCVWGWLFYILAELLPVTILFLVVIFFNISFTSGPLNGVIFFMQVIDTMKLSGENFIRINPEIKKFSRVHKLAYRTFTLRMLEIEEISFCLWKGANALDMLAFRYVTIIYSLFLVVATVFLMKMCTCRKKKLVVNLKRSIIHGLSAFVIMSYSECTRVSLMILTRGTITVGPKSKSEYQYKAFYNGKYDYLKEEHLKYALPAIFFILTMVTIPPLILLVYPLCYKLFALLRIEESKCVAITCKIFPLEKIKPMFDSMQGAFKDRYRCFAGLYLVYRLFLLLTFTYSSTLTAYYTITGVQLLGMLFIHSVCRPYKETWHNVLDTLLLTNLCIIDAMTFYNYHLTSLMSYNNHNGVIVEVCGVQTAMVLLPLVYLLIYITYNIIKRIKAACVCKHRPREQEEIDNTNEVIDSLDRRDFDDSVMEMNSYRLLGPKSKLN